MPFFKELRRRSQASFRTSDSSNESNGTVPTARSSSTLNSTNGTSTPSSLVKLNGSSSNLATMRAYGEANPPPVPQRPSTGPLSNRNSMIVCSQPYSVVAVLAPNLRLSQGLASSGSSSTMRSPTSTSPYAPKITSISDGTVVSWQMFFHA
jgi:hypothetical protein